MATTTPNLLLGLFDWENIRLNLKFTKPEDLQLEKRLKACVEWMKSIGTIWGLYTFAPQHQLFLVDKTLHSAGFNMVIYCPKIRERDGELDTTDDILVAEGTKLIEIIPGLTHVIIGSGDHGFAPMLEEAKKGKRIQVGVVAGDDNSISIETRKLIDRHPLTREEMKYIFSDRLT